MIPALQLLQLLYLLHPFVQHFSLMQNLISFFLQTLVLGHHSLPFFLKFLVILSDSSGHLPFLFEAPLCYISLRFQEFPLPDHFEIFLSFEFNLALVKF
jgi:hypothetical protein